ncbi:MAG: LysR family transcriptional regulator [Burkholderiales bacterium]|jgi:DNA-binding transcriptional LysR family regulator|nr:LysR family transcriptional regulator [Burkholderiales bacterium]
MDTKWLEDFVVLAETRSFSRAAQLRHITQPAFSRRIQALEAWLGMELLERTSYPPSLTAAGESFYKHAQDLINRIGSLRADLAEQPSADREVIGFALPHTLSLSFFPRWLTDVQTSLAGAGHAAPLLTRARVGNVLDVVLSLVEGACDLLICYHHPQQPVQLDAERYDMLTLDVERLAPYSARDAKRRPLFDLPGKSQRPVPYLAYTASAYLGRMADLALAAGRSRPHLRRVFDSDMAEGLKQMALAGHGVAFLPDSIAAADLAGGRLVRLAGGWEIEMQIRAYRERPTLARPSSRRAELLWQLLERRALPAVASSPAGSTRSHAGPARGGRARARTGHSTRPPTSTPRAGAVNRKERR